MPEDWRKVTICPSGLIPGEGSPNQTKDILTYAEAGISNDPNTRLSAVQFELDNHFVLSESIGISRQFMDNLPADNFIPKTEFITITMAKIITCYLTSTAASLFIVIHISNRSNSISEIPPKVKLGETTKLSSNQRFILQVRMVFPRRLRLH